MTTPTHEEINVYWLTTIAAADLEPTVAEINAGTNLTPYTPVAGVNVAAQDNRASLAMLGQSKIQERQGTQGKSATLTFVRHTLTADDDAWELFDYKDKGFLIVSRFGVANASGKRIEVYSAETSEPMMKPSAENELSQFDVGFAMDNWNLKAIVAA